MNDNALTHANTAAVGRLHPKASDRMRVLTSSLTNADFYARTYPQVAQQLEQCRSAVATLIGVSPDSLALMPSTSDAVASFLGAFPLRPGDTVAIGRGSFISIPTALIRAQQNGVGVVHIGSEQGLVTPHDLAATPTGTRLVIVDWVNYWSGTRNDMQPLVDHCRKANLPLLIDGVQGLGAAPLDFDISAAAGFACSGHKWLRGPEGTGFLYVADWMLPRLAPRHHGYRSLAVPDQLDVDRMVLSSDTRVFEVGTLNTIGFAGLSAALGQLQLEGPQATAKRVRQTATEVLCFLDAQDEVEVITPKAPSRRAGIISFRHRNVKSEVLARMLLDAGLVAGVRRQCVRISADADTSPESVIELLRGALDSVDT